MGHKHPGMSDAVQGQRRSRRSNAGIRQQDTDSMDIDEAVSANDAAERRRRRAGQRRARVNAHRRRRMEAEAPQRMQQRQWRWQQRHAAWGNPNSDPDTSDTFAARMQDPTDALGKLFSTGDYRPANIGRLEYVCGNCGAYKYARTDGDGGIIRSSVEKVVCCGAHQSVELPAAHISPDVPDVLRSIVDPHALNFNREHYDLWKRHSRSINS